MNIGLNFESIEEFSLFLSLVSVPSVKDIQSIKNGMVKQTPDAVTQQPGPVPAPTPTPAPAPVPTPVQTTAPTYKLDDLARAGMALMDIGKQGDLQALLIRFGVEALPALKPEQYGAFATELRGLGAQI